LKEINPYII
jgi:Ca2+-binding EF-hand superfamily protein